jgi:hypothetical protein
VSAARQPLLAETPEAAATGRPAELYADIRAVLGVPMVNLVYRHLATIPGTLEACWGALRPNLASAAAASMAATLVDLVSAGEVGPLPREHCSGLANATLAAYRRSNSLNLLGMWALLDGCRGRGAGGEELRAPPVREILPMAALEALQPATAALLDEMSRAIVGRSEPRLVPSLLRHFAGDARLLALLWAALRPAVREVGPAAETIEGRARELAVDLPYRVAPVAEARGTVREFAGAMARMLVVGELLSAALAEAP